MTLKGAILDFTTYSLNCKLYPTHMLNAAIVHTKSRAEHSMPHNAKGQLSFVFYQLKLHFFFNLGDFSLTLPVVGEETRVPTEKPQQETFRKFMRERECVCARTFV